MDFLVMAEPYDSPKFQINDLPFKQKFTEFEFWQVYFWSHYDGLYRPWKAFAAGFVGKLNFGFRAPVENLKVELRWTNAKGASFTVTEYNDDYHALKEIWDEKESDLRKLFEESEIDLTKFPGELSSITIRYWNFPPTVLLTSTNDEKKDFAESLYRKFWSLVGVIEATQSVI